MIRGAALAFLLVGAAPQEAPRPNILWITCEDMSSNLGCFGDAYAVTPAIDRLASEGVRYTHAFAPIGVCAPSRSTLILGTWPPSVGSQHMRCKGTLPDTVRCFPEYLRRAGFYCTNNVKTDYNFNAPKGSWDESSGNAHWRKRKPGQQFFSVFNFVSTHESQIRLPEAAFQKRMRALQKEEQHDPAKAPIPPYHPDLPEVRRDWARYYDNITFMDKEVARVLRELEEDGLANDTIVFFFSDHGAGMPRSKRWLYDSSTRVPLIIRFPEKFKALAPSAPGSATGRLVSFVDFGPTLLSLAGAAIPPHMQGLPFLGAKAAAPREVVHGFRDRMDERTDLCRSARDQRFKYIRNFMPHVTWAQHVSYMYLMPTMRAWQKLADEGKLEGPQKIFFSPTKPVEELYDTEADPHEVKNLAADPVHRGTLERLRKSVRDWMIEIRDLGMLPEADLRSRFGAVPPYDAVRANDAAYPLERLIDAAGTADLAKLRNLLADPDPAARYWGAVGCVALGEPARPAEADLKKALSDSAPSVAIAAADALCRLGFLDEPLLVLGRALSHPNEWARLQAAAALDGLGRKARPVMTEIRNGAEDKNEYVRRVIDHALETLGR